MVPENITIAPRNTAPTAEGVSPATENEKLISVHKGESLDDILDDANIPSETIRAVRAAFRAARGDMALRLETIIKRNMSAVIFKAPGVIIYSDESGICCSPMYSARLTALCFIQDTVNLADILLGLKRQIKSSSGICVSYSCIIT